MAYSTANYWSKEASKRRAVRFGQFLVAWRRRCGWSQYELPRWGKLAGFVSPSNGAVSGLENGETDSPRMSLFAGLAEANRRIAAQEFDGVTDRKLLDRLKAAVPVLDANGRPWEFQEFVAAFHLPHVVSGEIWEASAGPRTQAPELTDDELARVNEVLHSGFLEFARTHKPLNRALLLARQVAPPDQREAYEDALSGSGYSRDVLQQLWDEQAGEWAPLVWLGSLRGTDGQQ